MPLLAIVFIACYAVVSLVGALILFTNTAVAVKRRALPIVLGLSAILFLAFIVALRINLAFALAGWLWLLFLFAMHYRSIRFCDNCGQTAWVAPFQAPAQYCGRCGAALRNP